MGIIIVSWLIFSIVVAIVASSRGRSRFGWFLLSLLFSPLLMLILVALLPSRKADSNAPTEDTHVRCPDCCELVLNEARVCKHCGAKLVPLSVQKAKRISETKFLNRPEGMSMGEYQEKFIEHHDVTCRPNNIYLWNGKQLTGFSELQNAVKLESA
jgi:hypothetical protein